jgi:orotate phosphoribosyltransferase
LKRSLEGKGMPKRGEESYKTELSRILNTIGALKFGTFKLKSGRTTPYYIDLRILPGFPDAFLSVCDFYMEVIRSDLGFEDFDRISGIPTAGVPFASVISYLLKKPFLYVRSQRRLHGRERRIEGIIMPGDRVLLIDDLITTGVSLRRAAEAIKAEGGTVSDAVVLLDREEGGRERLAKDGILLHYLLKVSDVADKLYEMGVITEDQLRIILRQVRR